MKKWILITAIFLLIILDALIFGLIIKQKFINGQNENITHTPLPSLTPTLTLAYTPTTAITPTPTIIKIIKVPTSFAPLTLDDLFNKYGLMYGVDPDILNKIAGCESGFDPNQVTGDYAGLFQFGSLPWIEARDRLGANTDQNLRFNAEESIRTAAHEINIKGTSGWSDCD